MYKSQLVYDIIIQLHVHQIAHYMHCEAHFFSSYPSSSQSHSLQQEYNKYIHIQMPQATRFNFRSDTFYLLLQPS